MPLHSRLSFEPSDEPCDRFSLLGTYFTSPIQPNRTVYYARDVTATTFKVAATRNGAAIDITSNMTAGRVRRI